MTDEPSHVRVSRGAGVVTVTLDRPRTKNGIRTQDWLELRRVFNDIDKNADDRVVVLTGAGGNFSSGAELGREEVRVSPLTPMQVVNDACKAVRDVRQPCIAKVSGYAMGAGFNLVLACDLAIADTTAKFSQIFVHRGMSLDFGGSWQLAQAMSMHRAKEIAFFGDVIPAVDVHRLGLLNHVVDESELEEFVTEWASRLAQLPPIALARTKRLMNNAMDDGFDATLEHEAVAQQFNWTTNDTREAITAFFEKRKATFNGN